MRPYGQTLPACTKEPLQRTKARRRRIDGLTTFSTTTQLTSGADDMTKRNTPKRDSKGRFKRTK
jgi:hypothetical protein